MKDTPINEVREACKECFSPEYNRMLGEKLAEEETITTDDLDEVLNELEDECFNGPTERHKKPSLIQTFIASFYRRKSSPMVVKFQKLAGIKKVEPAAKLTIGDTTVELSEVPAWYNLLRYTLCGFKLEIPEK